LDYFLQFLMEMMLRSFQIEAKKKTKTVFRFLRNQEPKGKNVPNLSLSDYIAPESEILTDWIGAFVVTADIDKAEFDKFKDDDYATIMIRILSDRIAEAAAEWLHEKIRREYWGMQVRKSIG